VRAIERAAGEGAQFVCFPESYPGPWRMPASFDPTAALVHAAERHKVHVVFGTLEPIDAAADTAYNLTCMAFPDGRPLARYRRTHPNGPWIYTGGPSWEFQWVPGNDFPVFDTVHGKVGLAMCSEVYMPEVARALALRGAELIFMPAGRDKRRLWATWRTLIWARAIENLAILVTTQNLFDHSERGLAMVAAPEEILLESTSAGMSVMDVSLERLRYLWARREMLGSSEHCAVKQGLLGPQWRAPSFMARPIHGRCAKRRSDFLLAKLFLPVKVAVGSERAAFWGATCALPQVLSRPMLLAWQARTCR
jgi:predicted amidohydrolase